MSEETTQAAEAIRSIWQGNPATMAELDEECNPNKVLAKKEPTLQVLGKPSWRAKASLPPEARSLIWYLVPTTNCLETSDTS